MRGLLKRGIGVHHAGHFSISLSSCNFSLAKQVKITAYSLLSPSITHLQSTCNILSLLLGMLPLLKEIVEILFSRGLVKVTILSIFISYLL